jgi:hypothetical protein
MSGDNPVVTHGSPGSRGEVAAQSLVHNPVIADKPPTPTDLKNLLRVVVNIESSWLMLATSSFTLVSESLRATESIPKCCHFAVNALLKDPSSEQHPLMVLLVLPRLKVSRA